MNKLYLYNTLTRKKEEFKPLNPPNVTYYHCGPTVYWTQHIGNMRSVIFTDVLVRTLKYVDYKVKYVRNYTDVGHLSGDNEGDADTGEDRMEKGVKREGLTPNQIAEKYINIFEKDTKSLNADEPDFKPRATEFVNEMIEMVEVLIKKGFAYTTDLAIYFDVSKFEKYTELSKQNLEENIDNAGTGDVVDSNKKNQADFVLWFFKAGSHKNAIQFWQSPFSSVLVENGEGFPGWHIECSAMSKKYLGDTIDIHSGGIEHVSVHHTNEIAQSEAANGKKFVNYWLHNEHLLVNNGKMSKSEGTSYSVSEVEEKGFSPLALRYLFLQANYRSKQNFTWESMQSAQNGYEHLINIIRKFVDNIDLGKVKIDTDYKDKFISELGDDLNTPKALDIMHEMLKSELANEIKLKTVLDFDKVLGLDLSSLLKKEDLPKDIEELISKRRKAKQDKQWELSDKIRDEIIEKGFVVEDGKEGMRVYKK